MKGSLHTDELLGAVVARDTGLRTGRRISHVFVLDVPTYHKVLIVTDAAINIAPSLEDKVDILQNAIDLAVSLGVARPKVAILAAVETVTSKMPATIDAACLCKMAERGQITVGRCSTVRSPSTTRSASDAAKTKGITSERRRRSRHPAGAGPRGGEHPGQAAHLPGQRRQRRARARRAGADHPHQPRRQRARQDRQLRRRDARGARAAADAGRGRVVTRVRHKGASGMEDYVLVLNAGSSSLKFCVYQRSEAGLASSKREARSTASVRRRGSRPGTDKAPPPSRTSGSIAGVKDVALGARRTSPGGCARGTPAATCSASAIASSTAACATRSPAVVTPAVLAELRELVPLAPLHQPHNLAAIEAVSAAASGCAAGGLLRHQLPSRPAGGGRARAAARATSAPPASSATGSTACRTSTSPSVLPQHGARDRRPAASSSPTSAAAPACARSRTAGASTARSASRRSTACAWAPDPVRSIPAWCSTCSRCCGKSAAEVEKILYKQSGLLGISGISNDMRDLLGNPRAGGAARGRLLRLSRGAGDRRAGRRPRRDRRPGVHRGDRRELSRGPAPHLRGVRVARGPAGRRRQHAGASRVSRPPAAACRCGSFRPTRN